MVAVGSRSAAFPFMVDSTCSNTVTVASGNPREFTIMTQGCTGGVGPGNPCSVGVVFHPTAGGARRGQLNVVPAMGRRPRSMLEGTGLIAQLVWKPEQVAVRPGGGGCPEVPRGLR